MKQLVKGEKITLDSVHCSNLFEVGVTCHVNAGLPHIFCFGMGGTGQLTDAKYAIFSNQASSPENAVRALGAMGSYTELFRVDLVTLPQHIERLVFVAALDETSFSQLTTGQLDIQSSGRVLASYPLTRTDFTNETALIIAEIYKKSTWRMAAVGQGFRDGLPALLRYFGGEAIIGHMSRALVQYAPQPREEPRDTSHFPQRNEHTSHVNRHDSSSTGGIMSFLKNLGDTIRKGKDSLLAEVSKYKNASFMEAIVAGAVIISAADGNISSDEKQKLLQYVQNAEELKAFTAKDIIAVFNKIDQSYEFDVHIGKAEALKLVNRVKGHPEQARLVVRVAIAIANADGNFDESEKVAVSEICKELELNPTDFV